MPLSDVDRQLLLIQDVGDVDPATGDPVTPTTQGVTGIVFENIGRLWVKYSDKVVLSPELRDLYVLREGHDLVIGRLESLVDISTNNGQINVRLSKRAEVHRAQRESINAEIIRLERILSRQQSTLVGPIAITSPIAVPKPGDRSSPSVFGPDANDPHYSGSPYWGRNRRSF